MQYTIRHVTRFTYEAPISESVMEARMQPRTDLTLTAEAFVECRPPDPLPDNLGADAWVRLDGATPSGRFWDELNPSLFAHRTALLDELAEEIGLARGHDPLATVR